VPAGTRNNVAFSLGIPDDPAAAVGLLRTGRRHGQPRRDGAQVCATVDTRQRWPSRHTGEPTVGRVRGVTTEAAEVEQVSVLRLDVIRAAIEELRYRRIHPQFLSYLRVHQLARRSGSDVVTQGDWPEFGRYFFVPGGPPNKPQYRPFSIDDVHDDSGYWKGPNTAGSLAQSSIRAAAQFMLSPDRTRFELREGHAEAALRHLLNRERVPAWALAAFMLRNDGFLLEGTGGLDELLDAFRRTFEFQDDSEVFATLFTDESPRDVSDWFEPFNTAEEAE